MGRRCFLIRTSWGGVEFRQIPEFPDYYVGNTGVVVSLKNWKVRILRLDYNADGYPRVKLYNRFGHYYYFVHRLVAEAFVPKRPDDRIVDHWDTNVENNRAENLRWCRDMRENMANPNTQRKLRRNRLSRAAKRRAMIEAAATENCPF